MKIDLKKSKISVSLFLASCVGFLLAHNSKVPRTGSRKDILREYGSDALTISDYKLKFLWIDFSYEVVFTFFLILLALSVYLIIYKDDEELKFLYSSTSKKTRNFITSKVSSRKLKIQPNQNKQKPEQSIVNTKSSDVNLKITRFIELMSLTVLVFGFFNNEILLFFIVLPFYLLLSFKPKNKKDILKKAFLIPLLFVIGFAFLSNHPYYNFIQKISSNLVYYAISSILIYFTLTYELKHKRGFSFKHPLFWVSLLYLLQTIYKSILEINF